MAETNNEKAVELTFDAFHDDIPVDLAMELSEQMQAFTENENIHNEVLNKLAHTEGLMGDGSQLDDLLAAALQQEIASSFEESLGAIDTGFVNDVSVYNSEERVSIDFLPDDVEIDVELPTAEEHLNLEEPTSRLNIGIFIVVGAIFLVIIILVAVSVLLISLSKKPQNSQQKAYERFTISQPEFVPNNQNFIYLGLEATLGEEAINLEKLTLDQSATVFYFDKNFNGYNTTFSLTDNAGKSYDIDMSFSKDELSTEAGTAVRFEPLTGRGRSFTLSVYDKSLDESAVFEFDLDGGFAFTPAKFINSSIAFETTPDDLQITLENAIFSSSGTVINFTLKHPNDGSDIEMTPSSDLSVVSLESAVRTILPIRKSPILYQFPEYNMTLGRMDFSPVENLNDKMTLSFNSLFKNVKLNETIPTAGLFTNTEEGQHRLQYLGYTTVFERLKNFDDMYILVMHTEDKKGSTVESVPDISLALTIANGFDLVLDGSSRSNNFGTDVLFKASQFQDAIKSISPSQTSLKLKSVLLRLNNVSSSVNLAEAEDRLSLETNNAKSSVIDAFIERLRYKSSIIPVSQLSGFNENILTDEVLMNNYVPQETDQNGSPVYSAQIISYAFAAKDTLLCVVSESWQIERDGHTVQFNRTHKTVSKNSGRGWIIVSDEFVQ